MKMISVWCLLANRHLVSGDFRGEIRFIYFSACYKLLGGILSVIYHLFMYFSKATTTTKINWPYLGIKNNSQRGCSIPRVLLHRYHFHFALTLSICVLTFRNQNEFKQSTILIVASKLLEIMVTFLINSS